VLSVGRHRTRQWSRCAGSLRGKGIQHAWRHRPRRPRLGRAGDVHAGHEGGGRNQADEGRSGNHAMECRHGLRCACGEDRDRIVSHPVMPPIQTRVRRRESRSDLHAGRAKSFRRGIHQSRRCASATRIRLASPRVCARQSRTDTTRSRDQVKYRCDRPCAATLTRSELPVHNPWPAGAISVTTPRRLRGATFPQPTTSPSRCRAMTIRWISEVPSPISQIFASRIMRSTGYSFVHP